jgi:hypothetical protein
VPINDAGGVGWPGSDLLPCPVRVDPPFRRHAGYPTVRDEAFEPGMVYFGRREVAGLTEKEAIKASL